MSPGPLRRITAVVGLLSLVPIAAMVLTDALTPEQAAIRAVIVVSIVVIVGNLARMVITGLLHRVEKEVADTGHRSEAESGHGPAAAGQPGAESGQSRPRRRGEDHLEASPAT